MSVALGLLAGTTLANAQAGKPLLPISAGSGQGFSQEGFKRIDAFFAEQIAGKSLGDVLQERVWSKVGVPNTFFQLAEKDRPHLAQPLSIDPISDKPQKVGIHTKQVKFDCGGSCAYSTTGDYVRFGQMLLNGGGLDGKRVLGPQTVAFMTANHLKKTSKTFLIVYKNTNLYIIRNIMNNSFLQQQLDIGAKITAQRKVLGARAQSTARAAGISRVTLHRIEKGEASVNLGAYLKVCDVLGLHLDVLNPRKLEAPEVRRSEDVLALGVGNRHIRIGDYPQLTALSWQLDVDALLTDEEAMDIYVRNKRFLDLNQIDHHERLLMEKLIAEKGMENLFV